MKQPTKPHGCGKGGKKYVVKCKAERTGGAFSFLFFSFFPSGRRLIYIYTILSPSPLNQPLTVVTRSHPPTKPPGTGEREERRGRNVQSDSEIALCSEFSTFVGRKRGVKKKESKGSSLLSFPHRPKGSFSFLSPHPSTTRLLFFHRGEKKNALRSIPLVFHAVPTAQMKFANGVVPRKKKKKKLY